MISMFCSTVLSFWHIFSYRLFCASIMDLVPFYATYQLVLEQPLAGVLQPLAGVLYELTLSFTCWNMNNHMFHLLYEYGPSYLHTLVWYCLLAPYEVVLFLGQLPKGLVSMKIIFILYNDLFFPLSSWCGILLAHI